MYVPLTPEKTP